MRLPTRMQVLYGGLPVRTSMYFSDRLKYNAPWIVILLQKYIMVQVLEVLLEDPGPSQVM